MLTDCLSYQNSGYFTKIIIDYLDQKPELQSLYKRFPTIENFKQQFEEKKLFFDNNKRASLVAALKKQYKSFSISSSTERNIEALLQSETFTITTGHQLSLFSGPLYFLYKIISTINATDELNQKYPQQHFVPIFWMASEDHDFEEINHFSVHGKKIRWNKNSSGPVGRFSTEGLDAILEILKKELGLSQNSLYLTQLFENAYLKHENLADATRYLANDLFGKYGLVIIDGDDVDLKRAFVPYIKEELINQQAFQEVQRTIEKMKPYEIQVNPREINLFYIENHLRERIILENKIYKVNNTSLRFSRTEILEHVDKNPEKFSPNVILRPLYQEAILPNLAYIGGGAELAYWFELKSFFDTVGVPFPLLMLRNSVLLSTAKQAAKAKKLNLTWQHLFQKEAALRNNKANELSEFPIDLTIQKEHLKNQFHYLHVLANQTDKSFLGAVKAQEKKQIDGLERLENRLLKAQKRKYREELDRIIALQKELFPNGVLQERTTNFSEFYVAFGNEFLQRLIKELHPFENNFTILIL